jgi:hypothetical protein
VSGVPRSKSVLWNFKFVGTALAGSLVSVLVSAFAPAQTQIAVLGSTMIILAGFFAVYVEQEDIRERRRADLPCGSSGRRKKLNPGKPAPTPLLVIRGTGSSFHPRKSFAVQPRLELAEGGEDLGKQRGRGTDREISTIFDGESSATSARNRCRFFFPPHADWGNKHGICQIGLLFYIIHVIELVAMSCPPAPLVGDMRSGAGRDFVVPARSGCGSRCR